MSTNRHILVNGRHVLGEAYNKLLALLSYLTYERTLAKNHLLVPGQVCYTVFLRSETTLLMLA